MSPGERWKPPQTPPRERPVPHEKLPEDVLKMKERIHEKISEMAALHREAIEKTGKDPLPPGTVDLMRKYIAEVGKAETKEQIQLLEPKFFQLLGTLEGLKEARLKPSMRGIGRVLGVEKDFRPPLH